VFLETGFRFVQERNQLSTVRVLEVGFGTGLNFLLTAEHCRSAGIGLLYTGIEAHPLPLDTISATGYDSYVGNVVWNSFLQTYEEALSRPVTVYPGAGYQVAVTQLQDFETAEQFDLLYFDAFAALHQPEMWTTEALERCCRHLVPGGVFVTYAITGNLKRALRSLGFAVEKAPGAPGKREMLRAVR
jgi:tRNA U34 5-methylaminomethyl-2-thiouridine-forming methyltransferase MnmC